MLDTEEQIDNFLAELRGELLKAYVSPDGDRWIEAKLEKSQEKEYLDQTSHFQQCSPIRTTITIKINQQGTLVPMKHLCKSACKSDCYA